MFFACTVTRRVWEKNREAQPIFDGINAKLSSWKKAAQKFGLLLYFSKTT
jgi:hypothetical protein